MKKELKKKNPVVLHHKMYALRQRNLDWYNGQTRRQALERINTLRTLGTHADLKKDNGRRPAQ